MNVHDYSTGDMPDLEEPQWDTKAMQEGFEPLGLQAPFVVVQAPDNANGWTASMVWNPTAQYTTALSGQRIDGQHREQRKLRQ
jgi:hypothetical protein